MRITFDTGILGLTPGYVVLNAAGTVYQARTTAAITDLGGGTYSAEVADATLAGRTVVWDTGDADPAYGSESFPAAPTAVDLAPVLDAIAVLSAAVPEVDLSPVLAALDDVLAKTNTIGALAVTVTSPVAASGTITIEQGDSYSAGRSRAIDVNVDDVAHVRGLDAANVIVYLLATQFTWEAASVTETVPGYRVRFEPTIAETAAIRAARQSYKLKACIDQVEPTDDDAETIQRGTVVLNRDIPPVTP